MRSSPMRCWSVLLMSRSSRWPSSRRRRRPPPSGRFDSTDASSDAAELATLERLERGVGRLDDGAYWYDPRTGASGRWGGPTLAFLPPGLSLGGPLPADASGGGQGTLTGVFVNGRELHPLDVLGLQQLIGQVWPGRWWVDAQGNYGLEGGPALGNLVLLAPRRGSSSGGRQAWSKHYEGIDAGSRT